MNFSTQDEAVFFKDVSLFPVKDATGRIIALGKSIEQAKALIEALSRPEQNRVVITVEGGNISGASADDPSLSVVLVDHDNIGAGGKHPFGSQNECEKVLAGMHPVY